MAYDFSVFDYVLKRLDEGYVCWLIENEYLERAVHFDRLWSYYDNTSYPGDSQVSSNAGRPYLQAQEYGLPARITGVRRGYWGNVESGDRQEQVSRKEIVIENDIGWRIETIVDFLFGRSFTISSKVSDPERKAEIEKILEQVFEANGGILFFQQLALMGSVYGFVDVVVRAGGLFDNGRSAAKGTGLDEEIQLSDMSSKIILEAIEPVRSLPIINENDYRRIDYYIQYYYKSHNELAGEEHQIVNGSQKLSRCMEVISEKHWQRYENEQLTAEGENELGVMPVVHIQNMSIPYQYEGHSDVEPLVPLQDELNTRLSDRASRITFQSFKMYLGKGIDNFMKMPVGPGMMWHTDNPEAKIEEFGGDSGSTSEAEHIQQVRDAMEKSSGVAAIAAGIIRNRIGNLTSAVALKITLMGILAKNQRKRQCYGKGIKEMAELILRALDKSGMFENKPEEREIEIHWPNPLPENVTEILQEAKLKMDLGVSPEQVLKEIGY